MDQILNKPWYLLYLHRLVAFLLLFCYFVGSFFVNIYISSFSFDAFAGLFQILFGFLFYGFLFICLALGLIFSRKPKFVLDLRIFFLVVFFHFLILLQQYTFYLSLSGPDLFKKSLLFIYIPYSLGSLFIIIFFCYILSLLLLFYGLFFSQNSLSIKKKVLLFLLIIIISFFINFSENLYYISNIKGDVYSHLARNENNPQQCLFIPNLPKRLLCLENLAIKNKDYTICDLAVSHFGKNNIINNHRYQQREFAGTSCYLDVAKEIKKIISTTNEFCSEIPFSASRDKCYLSVATAYQPARLNFNQEEVACSLIENNAKPVEFKIFKLPDVPLSDYCYYRLRWESKDVKYCNYIKNNELNHECLNDRQVSSLNLEFQL